MSNIRKTTIYSAGLTLYLSMSGNSYSQGAAQIVTYPDGSQYIGQVINGKPMGQGRIQWANGDVYEGQWRNEQPHGTGKKTFLDRSVYEGEFVAGHQQGNGKLTYPDGTVYIGEWYADTPNGMGKFMFKEAGTYEGAVYVGLPHGQGMFTYRNGDVYDGQWQHGKRSGMGKLRYHSGDVYIGHFEQGQPQGTGSMSYANGFRFKGNFAEGLPDGDGTCSRPDEQALCSFIKGEQIAYAVIPDYLGDSSITVEAVPLDPTDSAPNIREDKLETDPEPTSKQAFVAALSEEKQKLKTHYNTSDLAAERSDILFSHNFETLNLEQALRSGWWETQNSLFNDNLVVHTRSGDLQIQLKIKQFNGPGVYRIKPDEISAWFKGKLLNGLRDFAQTVTIKSINEAWVEGNINLSFQQKDTYGDYYKIENGVFRLNNEPPFQPAL